MFWALEENVDRRPFTVPCRIVFAMPEDLEMWPYHLSFHFLTMVKRSSCTSVAFWILLRTSSFVTWSLLVPYSISSQGLGSFSRFLDLKLRKPIVDLDLIDKNRIFKLKGALTKVEMSKDRVDHKTHLSLLSLSHISGTFIFNFRNDDLPWILGFGQNVI